MGRPGKGGFDAHFEKKVCLVDCMRCTSASVPSWTSDLGWNTRALPHGGGQIVRKVSGRNSLAQVSPDRFRGWKGSRSKVFCVKGSGPMLVWGEAAVETRFPGSAFAAFLGLQTCASGVNGGEARGPPASGHIQSARRSAALQIPLLGVPPRLMKLGGRVCGRTGPEGVLREFGQN